MKKKNDDLKIDISEFFGTDAEAESTAVQPDPAVAQETQAQIEVPAMEPPTEIEAHTPVETSPADPPPVEIPSGVQTTEPSMPVDFNAPIHPPFMGGVKEPAMVSAPAPLEPVVKPAEEKKDAGPPNFQEGEEFLKLYDEFRVLIVRELADLVGERKTHAMLGRTVELAREKHPVIFKNVNWDASGNLLEDGSIDSRRVLENQWLLDSAKADRELDASLTALLNFRLHAIERGLGTGLKNKVRARLCHWTDGQIQKNKDERKKKTFQRLRSYLP